MASLADRLYAEANTRDATSHPMLKDLHQRTGIEGAQMLHAGVEEVDLSEMRSDRRDRASAIRIAYAGTILAAEEFTLFVRALHAMRERMSHPIVLQLYGSHSYAKASWFDTRWMREHGNLGERELVNELRKCTWGFAPMKLGDDDPRYNRFSFPTKFITYLAAGLPIISMGHPESSVMKMATQYRVGVTSSSSAIESLVADLGLWLVDRTPWSSYGSEIIRCAETEFRASSMRSKLWTCFERCAEATRVHRDATIRR
jgi:hypothetical protein